VYIQSPSFDPASCIFPSGSRLLPARRSCHPAGKNQNQEILSFQGSIEQLVLALAEFKTLGIGFVSCQEALDTSTPMGKAMFTIIGAMAQLERNVIQEVLANSRRPPFVPKT
jgi:hypothetical protein